MEDARARSRAGASRRACAKNGFVPGEPESITIGEAALLAVDVPLPKGIHLRRVTSEPDVHALSAMQEEVFRGGFAQEMAQMRCSEDWGSGDGMELWVAEADGEIVSSGRLEPVPATEFAGIWGGARDRNGVGAGSAAR